MLRRDLECVSAALAIAFVSVVGILKLSGGGSSRPMAEAWSEPQAEQGMVVSRGLHQPAAKPSCHLMPFQVCCGLRK